jgi:two-component system OmpR family sensor kinase
VASATASNAEAARPWSLEARLRLRLWALVALLWLAGAAMAWLGVRHETAEVLDGALQETAQRLLVLPEDALGDDDADPLAAGIGSHEEHVIYQVFDARGRLRLRSHAAPVEAILPPGSEGLHEAAPWRVMALTRDDGRRRVLVAEASVHRARLLASSGGWMLLPLLALLPLTALALHWGLRSGFRSVERAGAAMRSRDATDLRPVPLRDAPRELHPLLDGFNALLGRVGAVLDAERLFAARSAHELRTPLAAARAQAQRLIAATREPAALRHGERLLAQLDRLAALSSRLLQLARIESGISLRREPVDLTQLARLVVDELRGSPQADRVSLDVSAPAAVVEGDIDALAIALRNLVDNALRHGGDGPVGLRVEGRSLRVVDDGPGVDADSIERLKRPFERGPVQAEGAGLGLSMVASIARQSGARFELRSPVAHGRGLAASLHFDTPART